MEESEHEIAPDFTPEQQEKLKVLKQKHIEIR